MQLAGFVCNTCYLIAAVVFFDKTSTQADCMLSQLVMYHLLCYILCILLSVKTTITHHGV